MTIRETKEYFVVNFKFNPKLVTAVNMLPERRFNTAEKSWLIPKRHRDEVMKFARRFNFEVKDDETIIIPDIPPLPDLNIEVPLKLQLYPYQRQGVAYLIENKRTLIGDQPGLGKTGQAIGGLIAAEQTGGISFPAIIVCPSSLKINWQREFAKWSDKKAIILNDKIRRTWPLFLSSKLADVIIVNFESLVKYFVLEIKKDPKGNFRLKDITFTDNINIFKSIVVDESHRIRNTATQIAKFTKGLSINKEYIFLLSGTPVVNKPNDLISQLGILNRLREFGGTTAFEERYCAGEAKASNLKELYYRLATTCYFRREKKDVLKDLPDKIRQKIICTIDNRKEYNDAEADLINYLIKWRNATDDQIERAIRGEVMVKIGILRNISARGKINDVCEYINDILESGEKMVIFGHLQDVLHTIHSRYPHNSVLITGSVTQTQRQQNVDRFQNDPTCTLAVCNIRAAGVGLTLTASSTVGFIEEWWTAAENEQAEDRVHRIGTKTSVTAMYFLGENTIDEKVHEIVEMKRGIAKQITGSTEVIPFDTLRAFADLMLKKSDKNGKA